MKRLCQFFFALALSSIAASAVAQSIPPHQRQSGSETLSPDTREMQRNDRLNPGMLGVAEGERLWSSPAGETNKSCANCHGDAKARMAGVAARYPAFVEKAGIPRDLSAQVRHCRSEHQKAPDWPFESRPLLAMLAYLGVQSRGIPIRGGGDARLSPTLEAGRALYSKRMGQLNLACTSCHDEAWDKRLGGSRITQGHPTGYPIYRLEWQGLGSLQRRMRACMTGIRAEPFPYGAEEWIALELYLMERAKGMMLETPAVRP